MGKNSWQHLALPELHPKTSPYLSPLIKVRFGNSSDKHMVHEDCIRAYHKLSRHLNAVSTSDPLDLEEADSQVGHTFIHFLYSGTYEFLDGDILPSAETRDKEFEHGILVYSAAIKYGITELAQLAKDEVNKAAADLELSCMIQHARKHFDSIPRRDNWLLMLIKSLMEERIERDAETFLKEHFFEGFGKHETFDPHLCRFIVDIYEKRLAQLAEQLPATPEKNEQVSIHENGISVGAPDEELDHGLGDDVLEAKDLEAEYLEGISSPIENAVDSRPVEEDWPPDAPETVEFQTEYQLQEADTAEPETKTSAIETVSDLHNNAAELVQDPEADAIWDSWGNPSLIAGKKSKKAKKRAEAASRSLAKASQDHEDAVTGI